MGYDGCMEDASLRCDQNLNRLSFFYSWICYAAILYSIATNVYTLMLVVFGTIFLREARLWEDFWNLHVLIRMFLLVMCLGIAPELFTRLRWGTIYGLLMCL